MLNRKQSSAPVSTHAQILDEVGIFPIGGLAPQDVNGYIESFFDFHHHFDTFKSHAVKLYAGFDLSRKPNLVKRVGLSPLPSPPLGGSQRDVGPHESVVGE